ncbi:MAG TPA: SCO family protein [Verrucomicrobiae bacterium]|jgi:protein SCO1/2|nr:SCO family protein [Verrucomicrobiae bacterium]
MNPTVRRFPWTVGIGLLLLVLLASFALVFAKAERHNSLPVYGQVAEFSLTNQDSATVSLANLRGNVWIADIIFTRCPGPCLRMTRQMKELQDALPKKAQTKLISLTTDPDYDTPAILKTYAERAGSNLSRWTFLTGTKLQIAGLATGSLKLSAVEKKLDERATPEDLWVHSTIFVIVDKHAQLRGVYQTGGEDVDWTVEKQKILAAASELEREP